MINAAAKKWPRRKWNRRFGRSRGDREEVYKLSCFKLHGMKEGDQRARRPISIGTSKMMQSVSLTQLIGATPSLDAEQRRASSNG